MDVWVVNASARERVDERVVGECDGDEARVISGITAHEGVGMDTSIDKSVQSRSIGG